MKKLIQTTIRDEFQEQRIRRIKTISRSMFKCEICQDWCSRLEITKQWWQIAENDWRALNGKDLPYYIAILAVLRETMAEILYKNPTNENHSKMKTDLRGYNLLANKSCTFTPFKDSDKEEWQILSQALRIFRNGATHIVYLQHMNPYASPATSDPMYDFHRYAPYPNILHLNDNQLRSMHIFVRDAILADVRTDTTNIDRIKFELYHVERGPLINFFHYYMTELLKQVNCM
ncbi:MAG: hypothetical protein ACFFDW_07620 [Candidatus Thorarchaeota archaeon]